MKIKLDKAFNAKELEEVAKKAGLDFPNNISKGELIDLIINKSKAKEILDSKNKKELTKKKEKLVYCGPNIGLKANTNAVYIGGYPKSIEKEIKECPEIERLFVPTKDFALTKHNINLKGTKENIYYGKIIQYLNEKNRGDN